MLNGASGVEHKRKLAVRLLGEGLPFNTEKFRSAVVCLEFAVGVEARRGHFRRSRWERPLHAAIFFDEVIAQSRVVTEPSRRHLLPLLECVFRFPPAREQLIA